MRYFYKDVELNVPDTVYCPREDSELLAKAIEEMDFHGEKVLEVGCGCGLLSIMMAKKGADATAADINPIAVEATKDNSIRNNAEITALVSDLFESITEKFDLIVFNPPYLPDDDSEPAYSGGKTGREVIERFIRDVRGFLNDKGAVVTVISSVTGEEEVMEMFMSVGLRTAVLKRERIPLEELIVIKAGI